MRVIKLERDTKLDDLVAAAYTTTGPAAGAAERRASAALLASNPGLAGVAVVPKGTAVLVPSVPGLAPSARAAAPATVVGEQLDDAGARLKPALDRLREAVKRDADETARTLKLVGSAAFKKMVQEQAATAAPARLAEAEKVLKERQKERERLLKLVPALLDTARKDLTELQRRESARPF
jgi:hypothetical protein